MKAAKPAKLPKAALLTLVRAAEQEGRYRFADHALLRLQERNVTVFEVRQVLRTGRHEPKKDKHDKSLKSWNYAMRGKTIDGRELRIAVTPDRDGILIITVIDLDKSEQN